MKRHRILRFLSLLLVIASVFTFAPSTPIIQDSYIVQAATSDDWADGDEQGSNESTGNNTGVWNTSLAGLGLTENSNGSTDLLTRGSYTGEDDNYFYMYYLSKKKTSNSFYRTLGFLATTKSIDKNNEDANSMSQALMLTEAGLTESLMFNSLTENGISGSNGVCPIIYPDTNGSSDFQNTKAYDNEGVECVATLLKFSKQQLYNTLNTNGKLDELTWVTTNDKDGNTIFKGNVYLQAVTGVYVNGNLDNRVYTYLPKLQQAMTSNGFSSISISDVSDYYNFKMYLKKASNSVSFIDADTLEVLAYNDISKATDEMKDLLNFTWEKSGNLMFHGSDKRYHVVAGTMIPKGYYTETHSSSQFVSKVVAPAINNSKVYPYGLFDNSSALEVNNSFFNLTDVKSYQVSSSDGTYNMSKASVINSGLANTYGYVPSMTSTTGDISFSSSGSGNASSGTSQTSNFKGFHLYVFVSTDILDSSDDVVMYDQATGNKLKTDKVDYETQLKAVQEQYKKYINATPDHRGYWENEDGYNAGTWTSSDYTEKIPITYEFPINLPTLTNSYLSYNGMDHRDGTTLLKDIPITKADVLSGKAVLTNGAEQQKRLINTKAYIKVGKHYDYDDDLDFVTVELVKPAGTIYRGAYKDDAVITVLYYSNESGELIGREKTYADPKYSAKDVITLGDLTMYTKQVSYRTTVDAEKDIEDTKNNLPIMNSNDKNVTVGNTITIHDDVTKTKKYIIRVECDAQVTIKDKSDAEYIIPAQTLGKSFVYKDTLDAHVIPVKVPDSYEHEYVSGEDDEGNNEYSDCTVSYSHSYGTHYFDWNSKLNSVLSPLNYLFADLGGLTKISNLEASGGHDINTGATLDFFSHRINVDGVSPVLAKYMSSENSPAISYMESHNMSKLATEALKPNDRYSNSGGSAVGKLSFSSGNQTQHGQLLTQVRSHSGCDADDVVTERIVNTGEYTNKRVELKVVAEPSIVATPKIVAGAVAKVIGTSADKTQTYIQTSEDAIGFYPTYKMFIGGNNAWVLGKLERNLKSVNVAQIEMITNTPVVSLDSTWSRDKVDTGKLVMKGGYQYAISQNSPAEFKVKTYIVVPKDGWVADSYNIRAALTSKHQVLVNSLAKDTNFKYVSNLPEAFNDSYPNEFKLSNPYKQGADNLTKSRIAQPAVNITLGNTESTVMSLESLDALFTDVNNTQRLKNQLETNSWYVEKFEGFEVIKQVTTIKVQAGKVSATNFVRNGGTSYNDLARQIHNMPSAYHCFELALYQPKATFMGEEISVLSLTMPYAFNVRGTVYDDRS